MLMNYIHAFWVGGLICALVQILLDKTRLMPGKSHGSSGMYGKCAECTAFVRTVGGLCRCRCQCSADRIRTFVISGCERRDGTGGCSGSIYWRVKSQCRRYQCCADFRISFFFIFSSADEKIKKKETFSSCHIWKRYSIII